MRVPDRTLDVLADEYARRFHPALRPRRMIGREAEFPLVDEDGMAGDVRRLWEPLLARGGFVPQYDDPHEPTLIEALVGDEGTVEIEVGLGTVELVVGPCEDLWQLEQQSQRLLRRVADAAHHVGMRLLGFGIQPRSRASAGLMTPKRRYESLARAAGPAWRHFTTTAADQVHVDTTRGEVVDAVNTFNLLSGPLIALTANSSVVAGRPSRFVSGREGLLAGLGEDRTGMIPGPVTSIRGWVENICRLPCYVLRRNGGFEVYNRPFEEYLAAHGPDLDAYLWHEHYTWNTARPRSHRSTVEIRSACQQPHDAALVVAAVALGWAETLPDVRDFLHDRMADPWAAMQRYRQAVIIGGLRAAEPVEDLLERLLQIAERGLGRRGRGEEAFLAPLWQRFESRASPGEIARALVRARGVGALVGASAYRGRPVLG